MTGLAEYVHAMGRGPSKGRNLMREEAADAMRLILSGAAVPEAVGALFMLMRYRGETPAEIAGFVDAMRKHLSVWQGLGAAVDWPSYAAGRSRGLPWFLLSARLVAAAGYPVLIHGWNSHQQAIAGVANAVAAVSIPVSQSAAQAQLALAESGITYVPLQAMSPALLSLLQLRDVLGLRSPVNTALRALNPGLADLSVQGVFHPAYRALQADASRLLNQKHFAVIKGGGGEFERNPGKQIEVFHRTGGAERQFVAPELTSGAGRLSDLSDRPEDLANLWAGRIDNPTAAAVVTGTAALALHAMRPDWPLAATQARAQALWEDRHKLVKAA